MYKSPEHIVREVMYANDSFSQLLGMEILQIEHGEVKVTMEVSEKMTNGFNIAHGGISYSLADSAFAFASNSLGHVALTVETSISHLEKVVKGDTLTAIARLVHRSNKLGRFEVKVFNQDEALVANFKGTCYFTHKTH